jgi:uncharacterized membrane protein YfcA
MNNHINLNNHYKIIFTILIGIISGIIGGSTGVMASFIITPALYLLGIVPTYSKAIGTTLFFGLFPISLLAVLEYAKYDKVDYKIGLILAFTYVFFSYLGSKLNLLLELQNKQHILKYFVSFLLILSGILLGVNTKLEWV